VTRCKFQILAFFFRGKVGKVQSLFQFCREVPHLQKIKLLGSDGSPAAALQSEHALCFPRFLVVCKRVIVVCILTMLLLALALLATAFSTAAADGCESDSSWRAQLIDASIQGACKSQNYNLIGNFTVCAHPNLPPILFADATFLGAYLGGAHASAAGYEGGFTWTGSCIIDATQPPLLLSSCACSCNLNLQTRRDGSVAMYMVCASSIGQCLGSYDVMDSNASSHA
jgi:hypothetical protein